MPGETAEIVCCGHVCLDLIIEMPGGAMPDPGELLEVGPAVPAAGGSVSNTGLALHRMGLGVRLVGCIGDDAFGRQVRVLFDAAGAGLGDRLQTLPGEPTSYTVVIDSPGSDRRFFHCPGANGRFTDQHIPEDALAGTRLLHFGYPPAMRAVCKDGGAPLVRIMERARAAGLMTSLDMCGVAANSWASRIDWPRLLRRVLPLVDVFLPSTDELRAMLPTADDPGAAALAMGPKAVVVKDGVRGLDIRTTASADRLVAGWADRRLQASTFLVDVAGTTGAGDVTIAGFLAGLIRGAPLSHAADLACAAGAHCVTRADATSGVPSLSQLESYLASHPSRRTKGTP